jgi:hypothetical protein
MNKICVQSTNSEPGSTCPLLLLDLSAVFETVDYDVLLQHLQESFGIGEIALDWFHSYLCNRTQYVHRDSVRSSGLWCSTRLCPGSDSIYYMPAR